MNRYFIDERGGCIAVRDSERTDPDYNGLHADTEGVVEYWDGRRTEKKCSECGHVKFAGWEVSETDRLAAAELCDRLNLEPNFLIGQLDVAYTRGGESQIPFVEPGRQLGT